MDIVHEGKRFPCALCPDILSSAQARKRHVRLVHETRVKKLRCQTCGKAFKDRQTLRGHERTHYATRQGSSDPCPECGKRFSSRGAIREHVKTVHRKAGLEKNPVLLKDPAHWVFLVYFFCFFLFFLYFFVFFIFAQKREFLGFFQFQEYF